MRDLLGGKGANLAEMTGLGLPVPPGFVVTTQACNAFLAAGGFPPGLVDQVNAAMRCMEIATGKRFGDADNPLLVSCRSGAKFSMPGMMDTVLNIGMNDAVADGLAALTGDRRFALDAYRRLVQMFGTVVLGIEDEPFEAVLRQWRAHRGVANDAALDVADLETVVRDFKAIVEHESGHPFPSDPAAAARARDRSRIPVVERQARDRLPQRRRHRARPRHSGEHRRDGLRQHGSPIGDRRAHHAQRVDRRARARRRLAHECAGRGRRGRHSRDEADRFARRRDALALPPAREALREARAAFRRRAGRRVHDRARQAVDPADAQREAHRAGGRAHRGRARTGAPHHPPRSGAPRRARARRPFPASAIRHRGDESALASAAT